MWSKFFLIFLKKLFSVCWIFNICYWHISFVCFFSLEKNWNFFFSKKKSINSMILIREFSWETKSKNWKNQKNWKNWVSYLRFTDGASCFRNHQQNYSKRKKKTFESISWNLRVFSIAIVIIISLFDSLWQFISFFFGRSSFCCFQQNKTKKKWIKS